MRACVRVCVRTCVRVCVFFMAKGLSVIVAFPGFEYQQTSNMFYILFVLKIRQKCSLCCNRNWCLNAYLEIFLFSADNEQIRFLFI